MLLHMNEQLLYESCANSYSSMNIMVVYSKLFFYSKCFSAIFVVFKMLLTSHIIARL